MVAPKDPNLHRARWGGVFLAAGLVLTLLSFTLVLTLGAPAADAAQRAARVVENQATWRLSGTLGLFGNGLLAVGALFLATRPVATNRGMPASAFWLFVAVGALLFMGLDAFKAAALPELAAAYASAPSVYAAAEALRTLLVTFGMLLMTFGAAAVLWAETDAQNSPLPRPVGYVGTVTGALVFLAAAATLAGVQGLTVVYLAAYGTFLALLFLGLRLSWPAPEPEASPAARFARA